MGLNFKKRIKIMNGVYLNFSKSGISGSLKVGNITHNTKGRTTVNLGNGFTYTVNGRKKKKDQKIQSVTWDDLSEKQSKGLIILMKIICFVIGTMSLLLGLINPLFLILSVLSFVFGIKFKKPTA